MCSSSLEVSIDEAFEKQKLEINFHSLELSNGNIVSVVP